MKKSSPGMSALELTMVIIVMTVILAVYLFKASDSDINPARVKTIVTHLKLMGNMVENQKRHLGYYPISIDAMLSLPAYLPLAGNSSGYIITEADLRNPWSGPYLKGLLIGEEVTGSQRRKYIDLGEMIAPGVRGYIEFSPRNDLAGTVHHYSIYGINRASAAAVSALAEKILNKCNYEDGVVRIKTDFTAGIILGPTPRSPAATGRFMGKSPACIIIYGRAQCRLACAGRGKLIRGY